MQAPEFSLPNEKGEMVSLTILLVKNMLFFIFIRKIQRQVVQRKHVISAIRMRTSVN